MKFVVLIGFLILSVICYICFILIEQAPLWTGIVGTCGMLLSVILNSRSLLIQKKDTSAN